MGTYQRTYTRYNMKTRESTKLVETYEQPLTDRLRFLAFATAVKVTDWKPLHRLLDGPLESLHQRLHERKCAGDCTVGSVKDPSTGEWRDAVLCGLMPLCAHLDLKRYDLDTRRNARVSEEEV